MSDPLPMDALAADLFERHGRSVRAYLRALTGSVDLGDDLAQDVFLRVVKSAPTYEARERERAWLFRIAKNALTDHRRRALARPVTVLKARLGNSRGGNKQATIRDGDTIELEMPPYDLKGPGFDTQRTAIRVTVRRLS